MREVGMPADFVTKLFRMLQDIEVNKDLNNAFKNCMASSNNINMAGGLTIENCFKAALR